MKHRHAASWSFPNWILVLIVCCGANSVQAGTVEDIYQKGVSLYEQELYSDASQAFRDVQKLKPGFRLYFNIGQCEFAIKRYDLALEAFTSYLSGGANKITKERLDYVRNAITELETLVARVEIKEAETFDIWVDDEQRGVTPLSGALFVMEGDHSFSLTKNDKVVFKTQLKASKGDTVTVERPKEEENESATQLATNDVESAESAPEPSASEPAPVEQETIPPITASERKTSPLKPIGIALASVGGAMLVSGIVTGVLYTKKKNELEDDCPNQECSDDKEGRQDSVNSLSVITNVLLPVGGAIAVTGVVLAIVGHKRGKTETEDGKIMGIAPILNPNLAGVSLSGRF